ncbi:hypothetical protein KL86DPRO_11406 [uncultured delta proteobacterium]|uniref:Uncharacterized protein n=1 Tax=uncultured delta proteobacterium TaxID=34034 RepID=A0A212JGJ5_9DELT|nr:hypothetical protein KL86DPRO_11406 [uncultured delta proteobacterium]
MPCSYPQISYNIKDKYYAVTFRSRARSLCHGLYGGFRNFIRYTYLETELFQQYNFRLHAAVYFGISLLLPGA